MERSIVDDCNDIWTTYKSFRPLACMEMFTSEIGLPIEVVTLLWVRYKPFLYEYRVAIRDILMFLSHMTQYDSMIVMAGNWGYRDKGSVRNRIERTREALYNCLDEVRRAHRTCMSPYYHAYPLVMLLVSPYLLILPYLGVKLGEFTPLAAYI